MNTYKELANILDGIKDSLPDGAEKDAIETAITHYGSLIERDAKDAALQAIGECAASSLAEMVAALECDYGRRAELIAELQTLVDDEAQSRAELFVLGYVGNADAEAKKDLARWHSENDQELEELQLAGGDCESQDDARERIQEDPLSVEVRSGWALNREEFTADEFCILLGTGGPATRIIGELRDNEPHRARLQVQDWFTPWTDYRGDAISSDDLLTYCRCFYFGEG